MAGGQINWEGQGSENLPCTSGGHWVLAPAFNITGATLTVNGVSYIMAQSGQGSWAADSVGPLDASLTAYVTFTGSGDGRNHLQLSHCTGGPTSTPTNTPTPTATPTNTVTPTSTSQPTPTNTPTPTSTSTPQGEVTPTVTSTPDDRECDHKNGDGNLFVTAVGFKPGDQFRLTTTSGNGRWPFAWLDVSVEATQPMVYGLPGQTKITGAVAEDGTTLRMEPARSEVPACLAGRVTVYASTQPTPQPVLPTGAGGGADGGWLVILATPLVFGALLAFGRRRRMA